MTKQGRYDHLVPQLFRLLFSLINSLWWAASYRRNCSFKAQRFSYGILWIIVIGQKDVEFFQKGRCNEQPLKRYTNLYCWECDFPTLCAFKYIWGTATHVRSRNINVQVSLNICIMLHSVYITSNVHSGKIHSLIYIYIYDGDKQ